MRNADAALVEQILHIPKQSRVPDAHNYRQADDLRTGLEKVEYADTAHARKVIRSRSRLKPIFF